MLYKFAEFYIANRIGSISIASFSRKIRILTPLKKYPPKIGHFLRNFLRKPKNVQFQESILHGCITTLAIPEFNINLILPFSVGWASCWFCFEFSIGFIGNNLCSRRIAWLWQFLKPKTTFACPVQSISVRLMSSSRENLECWLDGFINPSPE